jgi:hypothetical protein
MIISELAVTELILVIQSVFDRIFNMNKITSSPALNYNVWYRLDNASSII